MSLYKFVLGIVMGLYIGFPGLNQLRFIAGDPMLTGILKETRLPPQSTLWRFLASLHLNVAAQILSIQRAMRQRVWQAANIRLQAVTLDTDTTVHTLYGQSDGALAKATTPKNKGKKSYQPHADLHRRDAGIRVGRIAQRRSSRAASRFTIISSMPLPPCHPASYRYRRGQIRDSIAPKP